MKKLVLSVLFIALLLGNGFAQNCPPGVTRYEASSFQYFNTSFSIIAFLFEGDTCGHSFWHFESGAYFDIYSDGSALLHGEATTFASLCNNSNGVTWDVYLSMSPSGPLMAKFPVGNPDTSLWHYFTIDSSSYLQNQINNEKVLLTGIPNTGVQVGLGANGKTPGFGMSTWFFYNRPGGRFRSGDFNIDLELVCSDTVECDGKNLRTQTPGGWGAKPRGNNPASYLYANFDSAFPNGLTLGCYYTLELTSASAITDFLPSGGKPGPLTKSYVDPTKKINVLAGHVTALTLSVGFDDYDEDFGNSDGFIGDYFVSKGDFEGWTVSEVLAEANKILGGCASSYDASDLNDVLDNINNNYVDGNLTGSFLTCDTSSQSQNKLKPQVELEESNSDEIQFTIFPNPVTADAVQIRFENLEAGSEIEFVLFNYFVQVVVKRTYQIDESNTLTFEGFNELNRGYYYLKLIKNGELINSSKLIKQ